MPGQAKFIRNALEVVMSKPRRAEWPAEKQVMAGSIGKDVDWLTCKLSGGHDMSEYRHQWTRKSVRVFHHYEECHKCGYVVNIIEAQANA